MEETTLVLYEALEDYEEATGQPGINDSTKRAIMMQVLPPELGIAVRNTVMAAQKTMATVTPDYLYTVIQQRCEFDETVGAGLG